MIFIYYIVFFEKTAKSPKQDLLYNFWKASKNRYEAVIIHFLFFSAFVNKNDRFD